MMKTVGGDAQAQNIFVHVGGSDLCKALEARYPGIRFTRVEVTVLDDEYHQYLKTFGHKDMDSVRVRFSYVGAEDVLRAHGWNEPYGAKSYVRYKRGSRVAAASFLDGLDRVAAMTVPPLLKRLQAAGQ